MEGRHGQIYRILNTKTSNFYIGSTINFSHRKREHFNDLRKGKHHCKYLQRSFNKWGEEAFTVDVLAGCPKEYLTKLEQWFVDNLNPAYNSAKDVIRPLKGRKWTEEQKQKMSDLHKGNKYAQGNKISEETKAHWSKVRTGKKHSEETKIKCRLAKSKPIIQYTLNGEKVKEWESATQAGKELNLGSQNISRVCLGKQRTAYKFYWSFK